MASLPRAVSLAALLLCAAEAAAQLPESRHEVTSRPGVTLPFIVVEPARPPAASAILFTGGDGVVGFKGTPPFPRGGNFLVRNRKAFAAHGLLVAVIDVPSDQAAGYGHFRVAEDHARDVGAVAAALRRLAEVPVWAVGTSRGTVSATNAAARPAISGVDGLVLASSITRRARREKGAQESVYDAGITRVRVPTLIVHHTSDACYATPAGDAQGLADAVTAPRRALRLFHGGAGGGTDVAACGANVAHGFAGIDAEVVKAIADWIKATPAP